MIPVENALAHLILCLYVFLRRWPDDVTSRLFVVYLLLTSLWNLNLAVMANGVPALPYGLGWPQLAAYGLIVLGILYWTFARAFLQQAWVAPWGWAVGGVGLVAAVAFGVGLPISPSAVLAWSRGRLDVQHIPAALSAVWWALFMGMAALTAEIQQFRTPSPAHKNRIYYLLVSSVLIMAGYSIYLSQQQPLGHASLLAILFGNALLTYTLLSEHLIDLSSGMRRAVMALVIALVTVAVYVAGIYLVEIFLGDFLDSLFLSRILGHTLLVATATAVLLTIVYTPIRQLSQRLLNAVLVGRRYDYQTVIHKYSQAISNVLYLTELADIAMTHINQALGVQRGALFILDSDTDGEYCLRILPALGADRLPATISLSKATPITQRLVHQRQALAQYSLDISPQFSSVPQEERQALKVLNFEWFVPILKKEQLIGAFALGHKRSGQPYSTQDLRLLHTLADQTALALENAALFDHLRRNLSETTRMKNLMDNVLASMANAVITTDVSGRITLFNRAAEYILGVPSQRCLGHQYAQVLPFLADTVLPDLITHVVDQKAHYANYEIASELPKRGRVNLSVHLTPIKDAQGGIMGVAMVLDDLTETKRLRAVQNMFRRYVSPAVVDRLPTDPDDLRLGGHRQEVSVLFADLRGFTALSEKLAPEVLVDVLNQYLSTAAASILMYEGTLDKFMGDAVMGIFNAPLEQEDHVLRAVRAAAAMQRAVAAYHYHVGERYGLSFGVGIHAGEAVVGNVGMPDRMDYTAIGDTVNLARRIQENAPGGKVLMSEAVYRVVQGSVDAVFHAEIRVRGRKQPVRLYELRWD
jgi:PAS domain S-box-containing protein